MLILNVSEGIYNVNRFIKKLYYNKKKKYKNKKELINLRKIDDI